MTRSVYRMVIAVVMLLTFCGVGNAQPQLNISYQSSDYRTGPIPIFTPFTMYIYVSGVDHSLTVLESGFSLPPEFATVGVTIYGDYFLAGSFPTDFSLGYTTSIPGQSYMVASIQIVVYSAPGSFYNCFPSATADHIWGASDGSSGTFEWFGQAPWYVTGGPIPPVADPEVHPTTGSVPLAVTFEANATDADGNDLSYFWVLSDGTISFDASPEHIYNEPGTYSVSFAVYDGVTEVNDVLTVEVVPAGAGVGDDLVTRPLADLHAFPNPFNPSTTITCTLRSDAVVDLAVFDLHGHRVKQLLSSEPHGAGSISLKWNGTDSTGRPLPSGVYFCRLNTEWGSTTERLVLVK